MVVQGTVTLPIDDLAVRLLEERWGGRLPTWDEFKAVNRAGRVRANKTIANQMVFANAVPKAYTVLYGMITVPFALLITPATVVAVLLGVVGGWWILGALALTVLLVKIAADGACEAMKAAADRNEALYTSLVRRGAFQFVPLGRS